MADRDPFVARGDWVDGRFRRPSSPTGEIGLEDPGDLDGLSGVFPFAAVALDDAVAAARRAWPAWRDAGPEERATPLRRMGGILREARERLAEVIAREVGKTRAEARAEVDAMIGKVSITLEEGLALLDDRTLELAEDRRGNWRAHARGVLGVLGPFNFPGHLVHGWVVPALACGNTVVVKPSERAPAVGQLYAALFAEAGLPRGVFNLVQGDGAQGARLAEHPDVDGVMFTGSWSVGRRILGATLDQPWKIVALEMGGKNATIVWDDADLDAAVYHTAFGTCATAGQRCSSTSRLIVHRSVADAVVERLAATMGRMRPGYPLDEDTFLGPVISAESQERHARLHETARAEGAEAVLSGGPCDGPRRGHYVRPSLHRVSRVSRESAYQQEEHFVPDLCVIPVRRIDEAIEAANGVAYGLVASVFTSDRRTFERIWRESRVGLLNWNTGTVGASSRLPFGGLGRSGNDRPAGVLATLACTYPVASLEVPTPPAPVPPPGFPWPA